MSEDINSFVLVGARFSRIVIDEARIDEASSELTVSVQRLGPVISGHKRDDRPVIEIGMRLTVASGDESENIVDIECTAGFVGAAQEMDGDLEAFGGHSEFFSRAVFWILRSRVQTLFAATRLQSAMLPWDIDSYEDVPKESAGKKKALKPSSRPKQTKTEGGKAGGKT